jgi:predicted metal-dependent hydrolase
MTKSLLPLYTVRVSDRAKYLRLQVSSQKGLEVIVPKGYDRDRIPEILASKQAWIDRVLGIATAKREFQQAQPTLPSHIHLQAIAQTWEVSYSEPKSDRENPRYVEKSKFQLLLNTNSPDRCHQLLRLWLLTTANRYLPQELRKISKAIALPFNQVSIRQQKTIWGSCSSSKNISLNYKLLFLPQPLVRYVLIHELCHTMHMNHSSKFWQLVETKEPNYKHLDPQLKDVWNIVPAWI